MTLRTIILDFDGVVVESNEVKTDAFQRLFTRFPEYVDAMMAFHHKHVSLSRFAKFEYLLGLLGRTDDEKLMAELSADFSSLVVDKMMSVPFVPGAEDFLRNVTPRIPVYLASVTPEEELLLILEERNLKHWFCGIYGCPPWTKPSAIRDVLSHERIDAASLMLIGDSAGDQKAAQSMGVRFLARDSGLNFDTPLPVIFSDLKQISDYLEKYLP